MYVYMGILSNTDGERWRLGKTPAVNHLLALAKAKRSRHASIFLVAIWSAASILAERILEQGFACLLPIFASIGVVCDEGENGGGN
jgi:hypothetical protein